MKSEEVDKGEYAKVAIKIVKSEKEEENDEIENQIFQLLYEKQVENPYGLIGLPKVIDHGNLEKTKERFFVMERLGVSLVEIIKRNKLKFSYQ